MSHSGMLEPVKVLAIILASENPIFFAATNEKDKLENRITFASVSVSLHPSNDKVHHSRYE